MNTRKQHGFTLVEIMVVVVILGMLATLVVPNLMGASDQARITKAATDLDAIKHAAEIYSLSNPGVPTMEQLIEVDERGNAALPDYEEIPKDPWGEEYYIEETEYAGKYAVMSSGPDKERDTEDDLSSNKKQ